MQRIEVTDSGITLTEITEPLVSVFGREMRPGRTSVSELPWEEIEGTRLDAIAQGDLVMLTVDVVYGEFIEVFADAEGFGAAVRELCLRSGVAVPDLDALPGEGVALG